MRLLANEMGVIQGVTTNPSIIAKEPKGSFEGLIQKLAEYCGAEDLSLSAEVFALDYDGMVRQANELYEKFSPVCNQFHVKIPVGFEGLRAIRTASKAGVRINATACYTEQQLQMCASAGAHYVSLFYCRLKQHGGDVAKFLIVLVTTSKRTLLIVKSLLVVFVLELMLLMLGVKVQIS